MPSPDSPIHEAATAAAGIIGTSLDRQSGHLSQSISASTQRQTEDLANLVGSQTTQLKTLTKEVGRLADAVELAVGLFAVKLTAGSDMPPEKLDQMIKAAEKSGLLPKRGSPFPPQ